MNPYYTEYSEYLQRLFPGQKVQKLSINTAAGCPNRDGTIGTGGCIYCDNRSFTPAYCRPSLSVAMQIQRGKEFFINKYQRMKYLAYFQSFTSTYLPTGNGVEKLLRMYAEALSEKNVVGLVIGTRPDCVPDSLLSGLASINASGTPVIMEYGAESSHNRTLSLINRGHTWQQVEDAVHRTNDAGISCGLHLIAGLPGEDDEAVLQTVYRACTLPVDSLKIHQLQVIRDTRLHRMLVAGEIKVKEYTLEEYVCLCAGIVKIVPRSIAIERFVSQSPPQMVISPRWGVKNYQFSAMLQKFLASENNRAFKSV